MNATSFEDILNTYGSLCWKNKGKSMMPLIKEDSDVLVINKSSIDSLKKYDIVLYKRERVNEKPLYILHRILKKNNDNSFWVVGDNCIGGENVFAEQILGRLDELIRDDSNVISKGNLKYRLYLFFWCRLYWGRFIVLWIKRFVFSLAYRAAKLIGVK